MLFNSYSFIFLFLPAAFIGMFWLGRYSHRMAVLWLGLASLTFYALWDIRFLPLLLASTGFNYAAGYWIGRRRANNETNQARHVLMAAIAVNLSVLGYFKYSNFFINSSSQLFGSHIAVLEIAIPLGISFFTFTQIAFLVDVYRGIAREYRIIHYLLFVTYFPHLIAGPLLHHKQMMPQFSNPATYRINAEHVAVGLSIFVMGLAKKVLVADNLAAYATPMFSAARDGQVLMLGEAWVGALAYTLQLYFDFSGYSDMAIGLSLMFNVRLPLNFDSPYKAISIIDFWRRWHMTLSAFLRDYLYFPLGGNRKGPARRYVNLMATMLLGGFWHGAGWTFIIWGGLHGLYLLINHAWRELKARAGFGEGGRVGRLFAGALTFVAVVVAWVFFRADNFASAWSILIGMAGINGLVEKWVPLREALKLIVPCLILVWAFPNVRQMLITYKPSWEDMAAIKTPSRRLDGPIAKWLVWRPTRTFAIALVILFLWSVDNLSKVSEFLYFRF